MEKSLSYDFRDYASTYRFATLTNSKAHLLFHGDGADELDLKNSLVLSRISYSQDRLSLH